MLWVNLPARDDRSIATVDANYTLSYDPAEDDAAGTGGRQPPAGGKARCSSQAHFPSRRRCVLVPPQTAHGLRRYLASRLPTRWMLGAGTLATLPAEQRLHANAAAGNSKPAT